MVLPRSVPVKGSKPWQAISSGSRTSLSLLRTTAYAQGMRKLPKLALEYDAQSAVPRGRRVGVSYTQADLLASSIGTS